MAKKSRALRHVPGGVAILRAELVWPVPAVLELVDAALAAAPATGKPPSPEYRAALNDLRNALPSERDLGGWTEATGEPPPLSLGELKRQAGLVGMDPNTLETGVWTPHDILPTVRGSLERRHAGREALPSAGLPLGKRSRRKRGQYSTAYSPEADARITEAWNAAKRRGTATIADFARDIGKPEAVIREALERSRKRRAAIRRLESSGQ